MPIYVPPLSRRAFVRGSLAASAALFLSRRFALAAPTDADPHFWALISDPHIAADRAKAARGIKPAEQFSRVVAEILDWKKRPAGVLFNGDIAYNSGFPEDYATFTALSAPLSEAGLPLWLGLGNHDHRERIWQSLRDHKRIADGLPDRQVAVVSAARANWFMLDSLDKTNVTPGVLGAAQLGWLATELDKRADKPALVMVHHNPNVGEAKGGLTETAELLAVLRPRRQVKAFFFGHSHRWSVTRDESGLHMINLPTTAYIFQPTQPTGWVAADLQPDGVRLELRALDRKHAAHGEVHALKWRA